MKIGRINLYIVFFTAVLAAAGCKNSTGSGNSLLALLGLSQQKKLVLNLFQEASLVLGQVNFTTLTVTDPAQNTFSNETYSKMALVGGKCYFPDNEWSRILVYNSFPESINQNADAVLGQEDFITDTANRGEAASENMTLNGPTAVSSDGTRFVITDFGNNRVLIYNTIPTAYNAPADVVVGQPDFTSTDANHGGISGATLASPRIAIIAAGKLIVVDRDNNRVLIFNTVPTANGATADVVIGQGDFIHNETNDVNQDGMAELDPDASTLCTPVDVWSDGRKLLVSDTNNNRILIWNRIPKVNFQPADVVVGQSAMTTHAPVTSASGLDGAYCISVYAGQLFVADTYNARVLVFNSIPTVNGADADIVLGQGDFIHNDNNDDNQDGASEATPTARTLYWPHGVYAMEGKLVVSDSWNRRVLVFVSLDL